MTDQIKPPPTLDQLRARRDEILAVAAKHGAYNVRVVGSVARGEATPESDVDLLLTIPGRRSIFELVGLWMDLEELLNCAVSIIPDNVENENFMNSVLEDAVNL